MANESNLLLDWNVIEYLCFSYWETITTVFHSFIADSLCINIVLSVLVYCLWPEHVVVRIMIVNRGLTTVFVALNVRSMLFKVIQVQNSETKKVLQDVHKDSWQM